MKRGTVFTLRYHFLFVCLGLVLSSCNTATPNATLESTALPSNVIVVDKDATGNGSGLAWQNAFPTLQDALNCIRVPLARGVGKTEIWVAKGVYYPDEGIGQTDNDVNATFALIPDVYIYGGFDGVGAGGSGGARESQRSQRNITTNLTTLSGDISQNDLDSDGDNITENVADIRNNALHVVSIDNNYATLDGFTLTAGNNGSLYSKCIERCGFYAINLDFIGNRRAIFLEGFNPTIYVADSRFMFNGGTNASAIYATNVDSAGGITVDRSYFYANTTRAINVQYMTIRNSTFLNNPKGAVNVLSSGTIANSVFENNGDSAVSGGPVSISNSTFKNNYGVNGGAMRSTYAGLTNVQFIGNQATNGGAVYSRMIEAKQTLFLGNTATSGGAIYGQLLEARNSVFSGNMAMENGGAIYNAASVNPGNDPTRLKLINVSLSMNSATGLGSAIYARKPTLKFLSLNLQNTILAGDGTTQIYNDGGSVTIGYSRVPHENNGVPYIINANGGTVSTSNVITGNPRFVDFDGADNVVGTLDDNLRLKSDSPAIDTGTNTFTTASPTDLDGNTRVLDGNSDGTATVDMGAYEFR
jgi:predicted outer membrane repeat protein